MNCKLCIGISLLFFASCNEPQENKAEPTKMTRKVEAWGTQHSDTTVQRSEKEPLATQVPGAEKIDITKPEIVVQEMINKAKAGDYNDMKTLCSDEALKSNDAQMICSGNTTLFKKLATATISADNIDVAGATATVPIRFNQNNEQKSMVRLIMKDGKWYIARIEDLKLN